MDWSEERWIDGIAETETCTHFKTHHPRDRVSLCKSLCNTAAVQPMGNNSANDVHPVNDKSHDEINTVPDG
jgi:hypothetical protein